MKRMTYLLALVLTFALAGHAQAQKETGGKMSGGKMSGGKMSGGKMDVGKTQSFTGTVKGAPTGETFMLSLHKGPMTIDMGKAKVRMNGKFAKKEVVKDGAMATVVGKMSGTTFMADSVSIKAATPAKMGGKMSGGKMAPKPKM